MRSNAWPALAAAVVIALGQSACATNRPIRGQTVQGPDPKLSTFAYIEDGDLITLVVDTWSARDRGDQAYIPLEVAVANKGLRMLTLSRESFTLLDSTGRRYPMAGPGELMSGYEYLDFDRNLSELPGILHNRFATFTRYESNFSPQRAAADLVLDKTQVPRFGYVVDFIYFPKPDTGIRDQSFELFLQAPQLEQPVFVKFEVK